VTPHIELVETEIIADRPDRVSRAPSDFLRLIVAACTLLVVVVLGWLFDEAISGFVADVLRGLETLPSWIVTSLVALSQVLALVIIVGGALVLAVRGQWRLFGSVVLAGALAAALSSALRPLTDQTGSQVMGIDDSYTLLESGSVASAAALAAVTAAVTTAAPWIARRWRRAGWTLVVLLAIVRFLGAPVGFDTLLAVLSGWVVGAAAVMAFGAPSRRPTGESIAAGLAAVGFPLVRLEQASLDARGSTPYFAIGRDGSALFVKALGDDERSADLLFRLYRRIQPHDLGDERAYSSLRRAVEHEALVALAARDLGVRTPRFMALATAEPNGYVLAYEAIAGRSLDRLSSEEFTDDLLRAVWAELALMRSRRIAHRDLRLANVFLADDGEVWMIDFGFSELAASDLLLANDLAELLASSTTQVGAERAIAAGLDALGPEALRTALGRLELPMLSGATRTAMKAAPGLLDELRDRISTVA
jgi:glycosyltransferase 2 family protein